MLKGIGKIILKLLELIVAIAIFIAIGIAIGFILWLPLHFLIGHRLGMEDFAGIGLAIEAIIIAIAATRQFKTKAEETTPAKQTSEQVPEQPITPASTASTAPAAPAASTVSERITARISRVK